MSDDVKICPRCLLDKPLSQFKSRNRWQKGAALWCEDCRKLRRETARVSEQMSRERIDQLRRLRPFQQSHSGIGNITEGPIVGQLLYVLRQMEQMTLGTPRTPTYRPSRE